MSVAIVTVAVDTTTQRLLLVLAAVLVGASVGLVGALVFGVTTGVRARSRRTQAVAAPAPAPRQPTAQPIGPAPVPSPFAGSGIGPVSPLYAVDSDVVRDRHRDLYDAEYVKQLDRVDALRRTIGTRLALAGDLPKPSEEPEELDA